MKIYGMRWAAGPTPYWVPQACPHCKGSGAPCGSGRGRGRTRGRHGNRWKGFRDGEAKCPGPKNVGSREDWIGCGGEVAERPPIDRDWKFYGLREVSTGDVRIVTYNGNTWEGVLDFVLNSRPVIAMIQEHKLKSQDSYDRACQQMLRQYGYKMIGGVALEGDSRRASAGTAILVSS